MIKGEIQVYRYNPNVDINPYYQRFLLNFESHYRITDVLIEIIKKYEIDISFETSCQSGVCGLCGVMLNHNPVLMCKEPATENMLIEPLKNFVIVKDLVINRNPYQNQFNQYQFYVVEESRNKKYSLHNKENHTEDMKIASRCARCFCCVAHCPVYSKNPDFFAGPAAFALEAYYVFHPYDCLDRRQIINKMGIKACLECGKCSSVCSFNSNPLKLIQEMKKLL